VVHGRKYGNSRANRNMGKQNPILHYPTFTFTTIDYKKVNAGLKR
jgi:hypothetical protein